MPLWNDSGLITAATYFAVGGSALVVALLAVEYYAARSSARVALATGALLGSGSLLAVLTFASWELAIAGGLLAAAALLTLVARTRSFQLAMQLATRPLAVIAVLLVLSLSAAAYVQVAATWTMGEFDVPLVVGTEFHSVNGLTALTDLGSPLPLIAYTDTDSLDEAERAYLGEERFRHQLIRLAPPSTACNCHGWVYTGGRFAIQSRFIPDLLAENGYKEVAQPQADDLVIYRGAAGSIEHTGVVRMVGKDGLVLVESKWGPLGVYLHPVASQPYGVEHRYYRSPRAGHLVTIVPNSSVPKTALPVLAGLPAIGIDSLDPSLTARLGKPGQRKIYERPILQTPGQRKS
jgi:hypothetical protein